MKFSDRRKSEASPRVRVEVWLEAGREGRCFSYSADAAFGLDPGDLVRVPLRGRPMHGLVVSRSALNELGSDPLQEVDALLQKAAVAPEWQQWLDHVAERCHLSPFRMLKAALPVGWLGQARSRAVQVGRLMWWVSLRQPGLDAPELTSRQQQVLSLLDNHGSGLWQRSLEQQGVSAGLLRALEKKGWIQREQRRRTPEDTLSQDQERLSWSRPVPSRRNNRM